MESFPQPTLTALLGQAVGDAFGAPFEFSPQAQRHAQTSLHQKRYLDAVHDVGSRIRFSRIPGLYTDDTQQALVLLRAWMDLENPNDAAAVALRFQSIITKMFDHWVKGSQTGVHRGTGRNFRDAIMFGGPTNSAGVGAAMRIGPISTCFDSIDELLPWVVTVSRVTTTHPLALTGAGMFAAFCQGTAQGKSMDTILAQLHAWNPPADLDRAWSLNLEALSILETRPEADLLIFAQATGAANKTLGCAASGFALTTVPWTIHHAQQGSFSDVMAAVSKSGGDTDTVCAMAGCLAALRLGRGAIPQWMQHGLKGRESIDNPMQWDPIHSEKILTEAEYQDQQQRQKNGSSSESTPIAPQSLPTIWEEVISEKPAPNSALKTEDEQKQQPRQTAASEPETSTPNVPAKGQLGLFD